MRKPYEGLALITDLDGTLLLPDKTLAPEDAAAIADFREKGGLFGIATGRGVQAAQEYIDLLQPDFPAIVYNGVMLYDGKTAQVRKCSRLPQSTNALLAELMEKFPETGVELLNEHGVYVVQDSEYERWHLKITHITPTICKLEECPAEKCCKSLCAAAPEVVERMIAYVAAKDDREVTYMKSDPQFLEFLPKGVSKGSALDALRAYLPQGTVIGASGDFDNDMVMLAHADYAGCPADAQECVKDVIASVNGYCSAKTCENGFFADFAAAFVRKHR